MNKKSKLIYILKAIAIICVIFAHCGNRISFCETDEIMDSIRHNIGTVGVPLFFLISGYLYNNNKHIGLFLKGKLPLVYSWLFWGTIVWLYEVLRKGFGYANLGKWLLGLGTYLWFMPTIFIFWIGFLGVKKTCGKAMVLALAVLLHTVIYEIPVLAFLNTVPIMNNVFCHMLFFAIGMVLKEWKKREFPVWAQLALALIMIVIPLYISEWRIQYHSVLFPLYAIGCSIICFCMAKQIQGRWGSNYMVWIGKHSFLIYMIHMPVAGLVSNLFSRSAITLKLVLLQPVVVLGIISVGVFVLQCVCQKFNWLGKIVGIEVNK